MIFDFSGDDCLTENFPLMVGDFLMFYFFWDGDIKFSTIIVNIEYDCENAHNTIGIPKLIMFNFDTNEFVDMGYHGILKNVSCIIRK